MQFAGSLARIAIEETKMEIEIMNIKTAVAESILRILLLDAFSLLASAVSTIVCATRFCVFLNMSQH